MGMTRRVGKPMASVSMRIHEEIVVDDSYKGLVGRMAERLTSLQEAIDTRRDEHSWTMATEYVTRYGPLKETAKAEGRKATPQAINKDIRRTPGYRGPGSSWLSHAKTTHEVFPEVFVVNHKKIAYDSYRRIANSRVDDKESLRQWAEEKKPTQQELRNRIALLVDPSRFSPIIKPSDNWNFNPVVYGKEKIREKIEGNGETVLDDENSESGGEEGHGYIPGDLYVNAFWYFARPGDVVVDLMAGSGMAMVVYDDRISWMPEDEVYDFDLRLFDLNPRGPYAGRITHHDAREPLPIERVNYIFADVPYFGMVKGQYSEKAADLANQGFIDWSTSIGQIAASCHAVQQAGDRVTIVSPNYSDVSHRYYIMIDEVIIKAFESVGYSYFHRACASRHIQKAQTRDMARSNHQAKENRTMLTDVSYILSFEFVEPTTPGLT
jgi:hypothetical protein